MMNLIKNKKYPTLYEKIQSEQPYYEIWQLSKKNNRVYFIFTDYSGENLDYNSTYFNQKKGSKIKYYLSEVKLNIDYFFYPRLVKAYSLPEIINLQKNIKPDDYIISDYELNDYWEKINDPSYFYQPKLPNQKDYDRKFVLFYKRLKRLEVSWKQYISVVRHPEKKYYIYQVVN